jgi:excinuclease ABC subunit C
MKTHYRTFNIHNRDTIPGDDYAMMREVLRRRFARLMREESAVPGNTGTAGDDKPVFPDRPDLVLIDGGQGQFDAAQGVLEELGVTGVVVAAIAKGPDRNAGRESFFMAGKEPFKLSPRDPALYFVQRLRDEAHRFAIGTHRARRKKEFTKSPLDEIQGVGPARKRALLHAFGTAKAISRAALSDFAKVPGINAATARLVYDFFHERGRQ